MQLAHVQCHSCHRGKLGSRSPLQLPHRQNHRRHILGGREGNGRKGPSWHSNSSLRKAVSAKSCLVGAGSHLSLRKEQAAAEAIGSIRRMHLEPAASAVFLQIPKQCRHTPSTTAQGACHRKTLAQRRWEVIQEKIRHLSPLTSLPGNHGGGAGPPCPRTLGVTPRASSCSKSIFWS